MENEQAGPEFTIPFYFESSDGFSNMMKESRGESDRVRHTSHQHDAHDAFEAVFTFDFANLQPGSRLFVVDSMSEAYNG